MRLDVDEPLVLLHLDGFCDIVWRHRIPRVAEVDQLRPRDPAAVRPALVLPKDRGRRKRPEAFFFFREGNGRRHPRRLVPLGVDRRDEPGDEGDELRHGGDLPVVGEQPLGEAVRALVLPLGLRRSDPAEADRDPDVGGELEDARVDRSLPAAYADERGHVVREDVFRRAPEEAQAMAEAPLERALRLRFRQLEVVDSGIAERGGEQIERDLFAARECHFDVLHPIALEDLPGIRFVQGVRRRGPGGRADGLPPDVRFEVGIGAGQAPFAFEVPIGRRNGDSFPGEHLGDFLGEGIEGGRLRPFLPRGRVQALHLLFDRVPVHVVFPGQRGVVRLYVHLFQEPQFGFELSHAIASFHRRLSCIAQIGESYFAQTGTFNIAIIR